jgi:hypothetical protein
VLLIADVSGNRIIDTRPLGQLKYDRHPELPTA